MKRLATADLVKEIAQLGTANIYTYFTGNSHIRILDITYPEGPIRIRRWETNIPEPSGNVGMGSISRQQLARTVTVCLNKPNFPLHIDRLFSAGGNTRSALETLLAHTPHFFMCYPKRLDSYTGEVLQNLKHIMWCPEEAHPLGEISVKEYDEEIAELELGLDFGYIDINETMLGDEFDSIEVKRLHTQMQIALVEIGQALGFKTWVAAMTGTFPLGTLH